MNKSRIVLVGGSGFLGRSLAAMLAGHGYAPVILTRSPHAGGTGGVEEVYWDGKSGGAWEAQLAGAAAVVNLAGRSVNCRYTTAHRREIVDSRVGSVRAVGAALAKCKTPPRVWVQAGSLAIYGDAGDRWCSEDALAGNGFPEQTCVLWEQAFDGIALPGARKVMLRISFAMGREGGIMQTLSTLTQCFLGGAVGSGRQYVSWIHVDDLNRMFLRAIEDESVAGVYNATGPNPVTNAEFMRELRSALGRPWSPPVPVWAAHTGAWLMRTEARLALTGRRGDPKRFREEIGFQFQFPELRGALDNLYRRNP
jgi:hypothetical protein